MLIYSYPQLIAVSHVLRRLLMPRHSPYALFRLNFSYSMNDLHSCAFLANNFFGCLLLLISPFVQNVVFYQLYFRKDHCVIFYSSLEDNISLFSIICFVFVLYSVFNEHISALGSTNNFVFRKTNASPAVVTAWWRRWESNPLPLECHSSALPSELRPH